MNVVLALRTCIFYAVYVPTIITFSVLGCTLGLLIPYRARQTFITTANAIVLWWLKLSCGIKVNVEGLDNIPNQPFVALSKHQSGWETFYLQRTLRPVSTILKKELLKVPFFGWGLAMTRPIAIDRSNPKQALRDVLSQGKQRLEEGNNILIFPEGTRIDYGEVGNYSRSGSSLAINAGAAVLPIAHNAGRCWPAHRFIKHPGTIHVIIGKPIDSTGRKSKELTDEVKDWIESTIGKL
ncbi:1-acyl-sn-glycerol-3-phosphate acyltransferase [Gammaproteobacteria bacterium 54_18_T64]|nr:1-acyl-sn-glycerol-3-phosphate acyltransferase [Gammaproteobacteria bacterium 54_18_T64]